MDKKAQLVTCGIKIAGTVGYSSVVARIKFLTA
jgi:hypothetical protein